MKIQEKILKTLSGLIKRGEKLSPNLGKDFGAMTDEGLNHAEFTKWNTQCLNLLSQIKTGRSVYLDKFIDEEDKGLGKRKKMGRGGHQHHSIAIEIYYKLAILGALEEDMNEGSFFEEELLITADAFEDILSQANYLLGGNYKDAAAVLIGAVLESTLRKLCNKHSLDFKKDATINPLNDLLKDSAYNTLMYKQIITWADLRNNAAHGHFNEYSQKDVKNMFTWVNNFVGSHLE